MFDIFEEFEKDFNGFMKSAEEFIEKQKARDKEIKKTLKFYAETRIGTKTGEGTYIATIEETPEGKVCIEYDPKPAIECLEKLEGGK